MFSSSSTTTTLEILQENFNINIFSDLFSVECKFFCPNSGYIFMLRITNMCMSLVMSYIYIYMAFPYIHICTQLYAISLIDVVDVKGVMPLKVLKVL